jgi:hypothetical protein
VYVSVGSSFAPSSGTRWVPVQTPGLSFADADTANTVPAPPISSSAVAAAAIFLMLVLLS